MRKTEVEEMPVNHQLVDIVTPVGLEFKNNSLIAGEIKGKIYGIIQYPNEVDVGWLSKITNVNESIFCMSVTPTDNAALMENISRNIAQNKGTAASTRDPLQKQRALRNVENGEATLQKIDREGEVVVFCSTAIMSVAKEHDVFNDICRRLESLITVIKCKVRCLANLQKEAYQTVSPYHVPKEKIEKMTRSIMPMSSIMGGFPISASSFSDGKGFYFGRDSRGSMISIDPWMRGGDRTNSNWTIMGVAGQGKSAAAKHIITAEFSKGTKIIIVDPETEYKDLTYQLGGDWIDIGSGRMGKINPLQIRPAPVDHDDDERADLKMYQGIQNSGDLALHLRTLEVFFNLYLPDISPIGRSLLEANIRELYNNFGITWDTKAEGMKNTDFPTMSDLYALIEEKAKDSETGSKTEYATLLSLMQDIAMGSSQFLWNGHTTIAPKSPVVCLDTHALQDASDKIKKTQYFNVLTWAWEQMSVDREERVLLVCDEAYLMIDSKVPQSLVFLRNVAKRARKYEAGIMIISHSVVDFLDPSIKQYGQALLDIPCYKVLMGTDGINLLEVSKLYDLTEAEKELLLSKKRKWALFMFGAKRLVVEFDLTHKLEYITGGGR